MTTKEKKEFYYEKNYRLRNFEAFDKFLIYEYDEEFSMIDHIQEIVDYERKYSDFLHKILKILGYNIDVNKPYIIGLGSTANVYLVSKNSVSYAAKFIWGMNNEKSYIQSLYGQMLIEEVGLGFSIPSLYLSMFNNSKITFEYVSIVDGEKFTLNHTYGIIIQELVGQSLEKLIKKLKPDEKRLISKKLSKLRKLYIENNLVHEDLHKGNITISNDGQIKFIDMDEVKELKGLDSKLKFNSLDSVITELSND